MDVAPLLPLLRSRLRLPLLPQPRAWPRALEPPPGAARRPRTRVRHAAPVDGRRVPARGARVAAGDRRVARPARGRARPGVGARGGGVERRPGSCWPAPAGSPTSWAGRSACRRTPPPFVSRGSCFSAVRRVPWGGARGGRVRRASGPCRPPSCRGSPGGLRGRGHHAQRAGHRIPRRHALARRLVLHRRVLPGGGARGCSPGSCPGRWPASGSASPCSAGGYAPPLFLVSWAAVMAGHVGVAPAWNVLVVSGTARVTGAAHLPNPPAAAAIGAVVLFVLAPLLAQFPRAAARTRRRPCRARAPRRPTSRPNPASAGTRSSSTCATSCARRAARTARPCGPAATDVPRRRCRWGSPRSARRAREGRDPLRTVRIGYDGPGTDGPRPCIQHPAQGRGSRRWRTWRKARTRRGPGVLCSCGMG